MHYLFGTQCIYSKCYFDLIRHNEIQRHGMSAFYTTHISNWYFLALHSALCLVHASIPEINNFCDFG